MELISSWKFKKIDLKTITANFCNSSKLMTQEVEAKLILVGDSNVGKTSIINRYISDEFKEAILPTLSSNYSLKTINTEKSTVRLQIWDTVGEEKYRSIVPMFYRGSQAAFIVYAIDDLKSFQSVDSYVESLQSHLDPQSLALFLIANKIDKEDDRQISSDDGEAYAQKINATYIEVSAFSGQGISEAFTLAAAQITNINIYQPSQDIEPEKEKPNTCKC